MAASSLLALIDDIATIMDDVFMMTRIAAKKTAGVLGDDLALNAEQVAGVKADRELPVVWAVAKGSVINKVILVPAALVISAFAPWAIVPMLMLGGGYLCYEGFEKIAHKYLHSAEELAAHRAKLLHAVADKKVDMVAFEKKKVKGAIRTDFILSAEIIVIALGVVAGQDLLTQFGVLSLIALLITVTVYGLVAGIVRMDDVGLALASSDSDFRQSIGRGLLAFAPILMKTLSIVGTAAMFMVGGGILAHGIAPVHHFIEHLSDSVGAVAFAGPVAAFILPSLLGALFGVIAGGVLVMGMKPLIKFKNAIAS